MPRTFCSWANSASIKGVDVLLKALAELKFARPVTATIVGSGPDAEPLQKLASTLGLDGLVTFAGALPVREAFGLGRIMVVPSLAESFPYVVLEAAAAGLPLIATNVGGIPEIVADTDTALIEPGNAAGLASALRATLDDAGRSKRPRQTPQSQDREQVHGGSHDRRRSRFLRRDVAPAGSTAVLGAEIAEPSPITAHRSTSHAHELTGMARRLLSRCHVYANGTRGNHGSDTRIRPIARPRPRLAAVRNSSRSEAPRLLAPVQPAGSAPYRRSS